MRKITSFLLVLTLLAGLALTAYADVIWEPYGDKYYEDNRDQFSYLGEIFYANSPTGTLTGFSKPQGDALTEVQNGELIYGTYLCTAEDGSQWVLGEFRDGETWKSVYYPMEDLLNRYDSEFFADHEAEIKDTMPDGTAPWDGKAFLMWTYPGGSYEEQDPAWWEDADFGEIMHRFYTDAKGNVWGYVGYWRGHRDRWICLTDWNNPELQEPEIFGGTVYFGENAAPLQEPVEKELAPKSGLQTLYVVLPLAAVALSAGALLLWPKKRK